MTEESFPAWLERTRKQLEAIMPRTVTESIYNGSEVIIALADVQHIEKHPKNSIPGIFVITSHTKWNFDRDLWENAIWISEPEATQFRSAWCRYRSELEADTLEVSNG